MSDQPVRLARTQNLIEAFNNQDIANCVQHLSSEVVWSRGDGTSLTGKDEVAAALQAFFTGFPDARMSSVLTLAFEPSAILVEWVLEGTHLGELVLSDRSESIPATGRAIRIVGADLLSFDSKGEIEWDDARIDTAVLFSQLGLAVNSNQDATRITDLAVRYTHAWCRQNAASVAEFYSVDGRLSINNGVPAVGRLAITESAQAFMSAFPDMKVTMDGLLIQRDRAVYRWTLEGTNTGAGGSGMRVRISGFEVWRIGADGLIVESRGHFDSGAYQRQIEKGDGNE